MFCHVSSEQVFGVHDVTSVYQVPLLLQSQGIVEFLRQRLKLEKVIITKEMEDKGKLLGKRWKDMTMWYVSPLTVAVSDQMHTLGRRGCLTPLPLHLSRKYTDLKDSYMSVTKVPEHSAFRIHRKAIFRRPHLQRKPHQQ